MTLGAYPGSFNPPTVAHLAIAEAAWRQGALDRLDLVVSRQPLGKPDDGRPPLADRIAVLEAVAAGRPWLGVRVTGAQLLCDIARGYDVVVLGADKWAQVVDPAWYGGSEDARDAAVAGLPRVLVAPRPPYPVPPGHVLVLPDAHAPISSSLVRAGRREWMAPEAAAMLSADPVRFAAWARPDMGPAVPSS